MRDIAQVFQYRQFAKLMNILFKNVLKIKQQYILVGNFLTFAIMQIKNF